MALPPPPDRDGAPPRRPPRSSDEGGRPMRRSEGGADGGARRKGGAHRRLRKPCVFCKEEVAIDYKQGDRLRKFVTERGKIQSRRSTGCCARHQRELSVVLKRARYMALVPYLTV